MRADEKAERQFETDGCTPGTPSQTPGTRREGATELVYGAARGRLSEDVVEKLKCVPSFVAFLAGRFRVLRRNFACLEACPSHFASIVTLRKRECGSFVRFEAFTRQDL